MSFIDKLKNTLNNDLNESYTENMALGYRTTGKNLLDLHFSVASLRGASERDIINAFAKAYFDDKKMAVKWLFYARDIRGGLGERRLFRVILKHLSANAEIPFVELLNLVPEYGRFDDLFCLLDTEYCDKVINIIKTQLNKDIEGQKSGRSVSLLAKWLPSINTSSATTRAAGKLVASKLNMTEPKYRKTLSSLRKYIDVVECKMSSNQFDEIDYSAVPSKANVIYKDAFLRHDELRRRAFLQNLERGETKINANVIYPHEIVHAYCSRSSVMQYDETLEQMWKALPDVVKNQDGADNSIVVADGSGSMLSYIGGATCTALSVANALAIYFAERSIGQFANKYITFSMNPQLVDLSRGNNLREKIQIALAHSEVANTDIYKVFQLILKTAVNNKMAQNQLPKNIIIVSDMEFDFCAANANEKLFNTINKDYKRYGYKLPRLVFWNVNSRTGTIPVKENSLGVALVSGFSTSIFNMVLSNEIDPYKCLLNVLNVDRYEVIENIMK